MNLNRKQKTNTDLPRVQEEILRVLKERSSSYSNPISSREISRVLNITPSYVREQARPLKQHDLVNVRRGQGGGYYLSPKSKSTSPISNALVWHTSPREEMDQYKDPYDSQTGLYNRLYLEEELARLTADLQLPISLIVAVVKKHKKLSHREMDRLVCKTAEVIKESCRQNDVVARWGRNEIAILLPGIGATQVQLICQRLEIALREINSNHSSLITLHTTTKTANNKTMKQVLTETLMWIQEMRQEPVSQ